MHGDFNASSIEQENEVQGSVFGYTDLKLNFNTEAFEKAEVSKGKIVVEEECYDSGKLIKIDAKDIMD